jgi:hypothetical protein
MQNNVVVLQVLYLAFSLMVTINEAPEIEMT